jgi:RimJ/RimL family protein N-acetyltransferase
MLKLFNRRNRHDNILVEGKRVDLRAITARDFKTIYRWFQDRELMEFAFGVVVENKVIQQISTDYFDDFVNGFNNAYGIITKGGLLLGFIRYSMRRDWENYARIGILIGNRDYWGKGLGSEAMTLALEILFVRKDLLRIELDTAMFNARAQKCFERCGFKKTGEFTEVNFMTGETTHKVLMKITRAEFLESSRDKGEKGQVEASKHGERPQAPH